MTASPVVEGSERPESDESHDNGSRREAQAFWSPGRLDNPGDNGFPFVAARCARSAFGMNAPPNRQRLHC